MHLTQEYLAAQNFLNQLKVSWSQQRVSEEKKDSFEIYWPLGIHFVFTGILLSTYCEY